MSQESNGRESFNELLQQTSIRDIISNSEELEISFSIRDLLFKLTPQDVIAYITTPDDSGNTQITGENQECTIIGTTG